MMMSQRLQAQLRDYERDHQSFGNRVCHFIGVPLITFSTLGLARAFSPTQIGLNGGPDGAWLLWFGASLFALGLDVGWGAGFAFIASLLTLAAHHFVWQLHLGFFMAGWAVQFYGHAHYERRSPAFLKNLKHLLSGPLWIFVSTVAPDDELQSLRDSSSN